jgi:hypothetical protein
MPDNITKQLLLPEPWLSFLSKLDESVSEPIDLHCLGGFVVTVVYGAERTTSDIDVLTFVPKNEAWAVLNQGQKGSELHKQYKIYLDPVDIVVPPEDYDKRLTEVFTETFRNIRLWLKTHERENSSIGIVPSN